MITFCFRLYEQNHCMICFGMRLLPNSSLEVIRKVGTLKRKNLLLVWGWPMTFEGFPDGKESACKCKRLGFDPWVGKIPWRMERLLTPVFWAGEFHGLYSPWGFKELDRTEQLSLSLTFDFIHLCSSPACVCVCVCVCVCFPLKRQLGHLALGEHSFKQKKEL